MIWQTVAEESRGSNIIWHNKGAAAVAFILCAMWCHAEWRLTDLGCWWKAQSVNVSLVTSLQVVYPGGPDLASWWGTASCYMCATRQACCLRYTVCSSAGSDPNTSALWSGSPCHRTWYTGDIRKQINNVVGLIKVIIAVTQCSPSLPTYLQAIGRQVQVQSSQTHWGAAASCQDKC